MESIFEFISKAPDSLVHRLYGEGQIDNSSSVWACKAVFQSLSSLSKSLVMRLVFINSTVDRRDLLSWMNPSSHLFFDSAILELAKMRIITEYPTEQTSTGFQLHECFRQNLLRTLSHPTIPWSDSDAMKRFKPDKKPPQIEEIEQLCADKWEDVLRCLVGIPLLHPSTTAANTGSSKSAPSVAENFLRRSGLKTNLRVENGQLITTVTEKGYRYMLSNRHQQVWTYVFATISRVGANSQIEALTLLFMLTSCELGESYPMEALSKLQQQLLFEFSQLGIIYMKSITSSRFYPTKIAITLLQSRAAPLSSKSKEMALPPEDNPVLSSGAAGGGAAAIAGATHDDSDSLTSQGQFQIIVETNNQVVAYLRSDLQLAMLALFVDVQIRLPNMVLGRLTRERVKQAYKLGISADQILGFLVSHCHPVVRNNRHIIPENVSDQLKLWEAEIQRIRVTPATSFNLGQISSLSLTQFREILAHLNRLHSLLWSNEETRVVLVTDDGAEQLQAFIEETFGIIYSE